MNKTQAHWGGLRVAPVLPSLQQEQQLGWDARLPTTAIDYYYQFKLTDYLERSNAKYIAEGPYSSPYFRIALHRRENNRQHQRLKICAATNEHTYYVAPEFYTIESFNSAFMNQQILAQSRLIPLRDCKDISDSDQHYIPFQRGSPKWTFHSEDEEHESSVSGEDLGGFYKTATRDARELDQRFAAEVFHKAAETATTALDKERERKRKRPLSREQIAEQRRQELESIELLHFDPGNRERTEVLRRASQVLSVFFGVTLVLVGPEQ